MVMSLKSFLLSQLATLVFYGLLFKYYYAPPTTDWHEICDAREGVGVPSLELLNAILWKTVDMYRAQLCGGTVSECGEPRKIEQLLNANRPSEIGYIEVEALSLGYDAPQLSNVRWNFTTERSDALSIDLDIIYQDKLNIRVSTSYDTGFPLGDIGASADISLIAFHTSISVTLPSSNTNAPTVAIQVSPHFSLYLDTWTEALGGLVTFSTRVNEEIRAQIGRVIAGRTWEVPLQRLTDLAPELA